MSRRIPLAEPAAERAKPVRISWKAKAERLAADFAEIAQENARLREAKRPVITAEHQAEIQRLVWGKSDQTDLQQAHVDLAVLKQKLSARADENLALRREVQRLQAELRPIRRWARKLKL